MIYILMIGWLTAAVITPAVKLVINDEKIWKEIDNVLKKH